MSIIIIFATLNLQYGVFNNAMIKFEDDRNCVISSMQGITTTLTIGLFFVYLIGHDFWNNIVGLPTVLMVCMFAEMLASPALSFWSARQRFDYKYRALVVITIAISILTPIIGIAAVLVSEDKGIARILSVAAVNVSVCLCIYIYNAIKGKKFFVRKYWKYALGFNIPLIPYYLSQMVFNTSDRIMINSLCGTDKAGIYSVAYSLALVLTFVLTAINNSYVPWTYRKLKKREYNDLNKISMIISMLIGAMLLMLILCAPEIIRLLATPDYYEARWVVPPVAASLFFLYQSQLSINVEFYYEKNIFLVKASIGAAIVNIVLNYFCIKSFGYLAAGYTTLLSYIIFSGSNYYFMRKITKDISSDQVYDGRFLLVLSIVFVGITMGLVLMYDMPFFRYCLLLIIGIIVFLNKKIIRSTVQQIKNDKSKD